MAATQGYDLYGLQSEKGASLARAMAWTQPYIARFTASVPARRLRHLLDEHRVAGPLIDECGGGDMSCFFADLR